MPPLNPALVGSIIIKKIPTVDNYTFILYQFNYNFHYLNYNFKVSRNVPFAALCFVPQRCYMLLRVVITSSLNETSRRYLFIIHHPSLIIHHSSLLHPTYHSTHIHKEIIAMFRLCSYIYFYTLYIMFPYVYYVKNRYATRRDTYCIKRVCK